MLNKLKFNLLNKKFSIFLILIIIFSFPFNDKLFLFLRAQDFFILLFILINFFFLEKKEIIFLGLLTSLLVLSNMIGILYFEKFYYYKIALFYKILIPLIFIFQIKKFINEKNYKLIGSMIDLSFIIYLAFILIFYGFGAKYNYFGLGYISSYMPLFPGSFQIFPESIFRGDRHLMGCLAALYLTIKLNLILQNKKYLNTLVFFLITILFMFIFESRTFLIFIVIQLYIISNFLFQKFQKKKTIQLLFYIILFILIFYFFKLAPGLVGVADRLFIFHEFEQLRSIIEYQIYDIGPHTERITRFFDLIPGNYLLLLTGVGFLYSEPLFMDSGIIFLFFSFGLIPLGFIYYYIYKNIDFNFTNQFSLNLILISTVLINLLVAEFFLVSRFVFIAILMFYYSSVETKLIASEHKNKY